jgi:hypothetical protein
LRPFAHAVGASPARAFVVPRAQPGPGNKLAGCREPAHVDAALRQDFPGGQRADTGNGDQPPEGLAKGLVAPGNLLVDAGDGTVQRPDMLHVQLEQEPVMPGHPPAQRLDQRVGGRLDPPVSQFGQLHRIVVAGDQGADDGLSALAHDVMSERTDPSLMLQSSRTA